MIGLAINCYPAGSDCRWHCLLIIHAAWNARSGYQRGRYEIRRDNMVVFSELWQKYTPPLNTLRPRQNGRHFPDDIFKCIFLNGNAWISIKISLKFVPKGPINKIPSLVQIMAWRRPGDKPLSEPMMVSLLTHICVTRPLWVKAFMFCCGLVLDDLTTMVCVCTQTMRDHYTL